MPTAPVQLQSEPFVAPASGAARRSLAPLLPGADRKILTAKAFKGKPSRRCLVIRLDGLERGHQHQERNKRGARTYVTIIAVRCFHSLEERLARLSHDNVQVEWVGR